MFILGILFLTGVLIFFILLFKILVSYLYSSNEVKEVKELSSYLKENSENSYLNPDTESVTVEDSAEKVIPIKNIEEMSSRTEDCTRHLKVDIESATAAKLRKVWEYFLYGEVKEGVSKEYSMATNWFTRIGFLVLLLSVGFFLRYSIMQGWINNHGKTAMGLLFGAALSVQGTSMAGKQYSLLGQGMIAVGLSSLYASFFAAANMYGIISSQMAFLCMLMVTCVAGLLSVRLNLRVVAVLGMIGGYLTPLLVGSTTNGILDILVYLAILGVGVLGISLKKKWYVLNWLGMLATYGLLFKFMGAYTKDFFAVTFSFVTFYFAVFSVIPVLYSRNSEKQSTLMEVFGVFANSMCFIYFANNLIKDSVDKDFLAIVTLGLGFFYLILSGVCRKNNAEDKALMLSFISLSGFFTTITMPILFSEQYLTVAWAIQAYAFMWLAGKFDSKFIQKISYLIYTLVFGCLMKFQFPQFGEPVDMMTFSQYVPVFVGRLITIGIPVLSFIAASLKIKVNSKASTGEKFDMEQEFSLFTCIAVALLTLFVHLEVIRMAEVIYKPLQGPAITFIWAAICAYHIFRTEYDKTNLNVILIVFCLMLKILLFDIQIQNIDFYHLIYKGSYMPAMSLVRIFNFGFIIGVIYLFANWVKRDEPAVAETVVRDCHICIGIAFFAVLTFELSTVLFNLLPEARQGGISILWAVFALKLIIDGLKNNLRSKRYSGLILFVVITVKVFVIDLSNVGQIYKILAFFVLGLCFFAGSFLYMKNQKQFVTEVQA